MALIDERHPRLARLAALWTARRRGATLPLASALVPDRLDDLADLAVVLTAKANGADRLEITSSGATVDALYGAPLTGAPARRLAPGRGDAEAEALSAVEAARPVLVEDDLVVADHRRRVARLYLPLANDDGSPNGVLCGVVAVA